MKYKSSQYCPNCHFPLPYKAKFCAQCGQRANDGKVTMYALFKQLWVRVFHIEGRLLRSLKDIFIPGKITEEFFKGKQKRYPPPMQFFFVVMFFFLFALNGLLKSTDKDGSAGIFRFKIDSGTDSAGVKEVGGRTFYENLQQAAIVQELRGSYDSLPPGLRSPASRQAVDSLLRLYMENRGLDVAMLLEKTDSNAAKIPDSLPVNLIKGRFKIAAFDVARYSSREIIERYRITNRLDQTLVQQVIKSLKEPEALAHAYISSLGWTMLAITAFMAAILRLFYRRQRRYYVEHFIFLLHFHTGAFLVLALGILAAEIKMIEPTTIVLLLPLIGIALFLAMRRFYHQGIVRTFLNWALFSIIYSIGFGLLFGLGLIVVFIVY